MKGIALAFPVAQTAVSQFGLSLLKLPNGKESFESLLFGLQSLVAFTADAVTGVRLLIKFISAVNPAAKIADVALDELGFTTEKVDGIVNDFKTDLADLDTQGTGQAAIDNLEELSEAGIEAHHLMVLFHHLLVLLGSPEEYR